MSWCNNPVAAAAVAAALACAIVRRARNNNTYSDSPEQKDRSARWNAIYTRKGALADMSTPLHVLGGYDMYTLEQWVQQVALLCGPTTGRRALGLFKGARLLEVGVGGGAFVDGLDRAYADADGTSDQVCGLQLHGVDYSVSLIKCVSARLSGRFAVADARDLGATVPWLRDGDAARVPNFDCVVSFGVTQYLNDLDDVRKMICEMGRVAHPGARVLVAEVSDMGKKALADQLRGKTHASGKLKKVSSDAPTHLYVPKDFWEETARSAGLEVICIEDHTQIGLSYATAAYRYSVWLKKL